MIRRHPIARSTKPIPRRAPVRKRRTKPRRGRVIDKSYLAWIAQQPCMISGKPATVHHVRRFGEPKSDHRILPLAPEYHQIQAGHTSIEALGKRKFEVMYGVNLETRIVQYQQDYMAAGFRLIAEAVP